MGKIRAGVTAQIRVYWPIVFVVEDSHILSSKQAKKSRKILNDTRNLLLLQVADNPELRLASRAGKQLSNIEYHGKGSSISKTRRRKENSAPAGRIMCFLPDNDAENFRRKIITFYVDFRTTCHDFQNSFKINEAIFTFFSLKCIRWTIIPNQTFHSTRYITSKHVTSLRWPSPRHSAKATQLPLPACLHRCWSGGKTFTTLWKIWSAQNLNSRTSQTRGARVNRWTLP